LAQRWFAFGDDFAVEAEAGREACFVDGRAFSWGKKLSVEAPRGREVAFIAQRLLTWGPTYEITRDGVLAAVVKKELFTFFRCRFAVDVPGPDDLEAVGDFLVHEYELVRGGDVVATVSKAWWSWTDSIRRRRRDDYLAICVAVVIDTRATSADPSVASVASRRSRSGGRDPSPGPRGRRPRSRSVDRHRRPCPCVCCTEAAVGSSARPSVEWP
jgi:uncharacterized protein YxjI